MGTHGGRLKSNGSGASIKTKTKVEVLHLFYHSFYFLVSREKILLNFSFISLGWLFITYGLPVSLG